MSKCVMRVEFEGGARWCTNDAEASVSNRGGYWLVCRGHIYAAISSAFSSGTAGVHVQVLPGTWW